ncbi:MAG: efflux RND transporter periplasmic adaptor subunit [Caulobacteraceae bacterium]
MHRVPAVIVLAIVCALTASACGARKPPPAAPGAPSVTVATPLAMRVVDWDDFLGRFVAVDSVDVRPRVTGYLESVGFRDGEFVRKGQVLFMIDPRPYRATLDLATAQGARARAALINAAAQLARGGTLLAAHAISQQAYDLLLATQRQAAADVLSAQASVRGAALNLAFTRVTAPMAGRISDRRIAPGNLVTADTTVLTNIVNLDPIRFAFTGSEALYLKYERENAAGTRTSSRLTANPVEIRLQDEPTWRWKGRMEFVDNALDTASGTIRGRAVVANPDHFLTPGMFGHLRLLGSGSYPALLVPDRAVITDQERQVVYVVGADGIARMRPVQLGPVTQGLRVIRSGLAAGDLVVIDGVQLAQSGHKVKARRGRIVAVAATPPGNVDAAPPSSSAEPAGTFR